MYYITINWLYSCIVFYLIVFFKYEIQQLRQILFSVNRPIVKVVVKDYESDSTIYKSTIHNFRKGTWACGLRPCPVEFVARTRAIANTCSRHFHNWASSQKPGPRILCEGLRSRCNLCWAALVPESGPTLTINKLKNMVMVGSGPW